MKTRHTTKKAPTRTRRAALHNDKDETREEIIDWLRDAYAMERGMEASLQKQADNEDLDRTIRQRARTHLQETRRHAEEVKSALQSLDTDTSSLKTSMGMITQAAKGIGTIFAGDERIKDLLDAYSMEHFEIACYTALAAAAKKASLSQVEKTCRRILGDEERMAQTLKKALPGEVVSYLFEAETANA